MSVFDPRADFLPGIVLRQPYAGLVRLGRKPLETRGFRIQYRGELVIVAGASADEGALVRLATRLRAVEGGERAFGLRGMVAAVARVVGCRPLVPADEPRAWFYAPDRWAWELEDIRPLVPRAFRGSQGFFLVPRKLVEVERAA